MSRRAARAVLALLLVVASGLAALTAPASAGGSFGRLDGRIAFVRGEQVHTIDRWGGDEKQLTHTGRNSGPTWSPDGRRIAYIHEVDGRRDVWVMASGGAFKRPVTRSGDVTSTTATWSPDGRTLAYAAGGRLVTIRSRAPHGAPRPVSAVPTGGWCDSGDGEAQEVLVDRFVAWSPDGSRIAVLNHSDCYFDDRMDHVHLDTGERRQYAATGADCCGYLEWSDLFWGPDGQFGWSEADTGQYGEEPDAPSRIVYPGFASLDGDTGGAASPSGHFLALSSSATGTELLIRARSDGSHRKVLAVGSQPDWQARPR
ncbi:PD40 domain-containing protein [Nocardioides sp. SYSU D00065]|uniref:PD40 domain-containing protein n=1 Tax=Nocardioides sp. SYSU D00065 TaxID=2817378 RepID=UPI001B340126|nr:PD40 domain-containing protein [Nocardioides sp. SYSU D00065]